jgi:hypothetical protein
MTLTRAGHPPLVLLTAYCVLLTGCASRTYLVRLPVADLRAEPNSFPRSMEHDPKQETQLLYGERVRITARQGDWVRVEAIEQPEFTHHNRWEGYPGWLPEEAIRPLPRHWMPNGLVGLHWATVWQDRIANTPWLRLPLGAPVVVLDTDGPMWPVLLQSGTKGWIASGDVALRSDLDRLSDEERRRLIIRSAQSFIGTAYFWGGRTPSSGPAEGGITGVDCSGLVNLAYRAAGIQIPRDAHEQYLRSVRVSRPKPADLVFLSAPGDPLAIVHVMLVAEDGKLIEAPGTGRTARQIPADERLGKTLPRLQPGDYVEAQRIDFGSYLP